jgi:hypothetical protein
MVTNAKFVEIGLYYKLCSSPRDEGYLTTVERQVKKYVDYLGSDPTLELNDEQCTISIRLLTIGRPSEISPSMQVAYVMVANAPREQ